MKKVIALALGVCFIGSFVKAQSVDSKYGPDSVKTMEQASIYFEFVKQKNYKDALPGWRYVFNNAPKFRMDTYTKGEDIMAGMYEKTKNQAYIDTMMMVYDQWMKNFGDHARYGEGYILGKKGFNLYRFRGVNNTEAAKEAFGYLTKSFEMQGDKSNPLIVKMTFAVADDLLKKGELSKDEYMKLYLQFSDFAERGMSTAQKKAPYEDLKTTVDALFFNAGVADCQTLSEFLTPKFEKDKENMEVLKEISGLLKRGECTDVPLFAEVAENMYRLDPTAEAAYNLAIMFLKKKEYDKTESYLQEAIDKSTDDTAKAEYYLRMAQIKLSKKELPQAKKNALEALKLNPSMGEAYLIIGNAYAAYSKNYGEDDFDHAAVFWAAVDKFIKAKQVDPSVTEAANKLINAYSPYFPSKDEAFFRSVTSGTSVKLGDWINETTTARFR